MNESSTQDAPPNEVSQGEASEAAAEAAAPTPPPEVIEEPPIAPDVPRMARPQGSAKVSPTSIPSPVFLAVVAVFTFAADVVTKLWAEQRLQGYPGYIRLIDDHLMLVLAKNKGGAWGLLQGQSEHVRRPFFLLVSIAAIAFIVTLYRRLQPHQRALKWGLPLVLGGALGNVFDRIRYGYVIDFIDYRADWIKKLNELVQKNVSSHIVTDHWPTFNIADVAICAGVALMAIDMLTARRGKPRLAPDVPLQPVNEPVTELAVEGAPASEALAAEAAESGESSATTPEGEPAPSEATDAPAPRDEAESGGSPPPRDEH